MAAIRRERQEAGIDGGHRQPKRRHGARISIPAKGIDALAAALLCIGAGKDQSGGCGGPSPDTRCKGEG